MVFFVRKYHFLLSMPLRYCENRLESDSSATLDLAGPSSSKPLENRFLSAHTVKVHTTEKTTTQKKQATSVQQS